MSEHSPFDLTVTEVEYSSMGIREAYQAYIYDSICDDHITLTTGIIKSEGIYNIRDSIHMNPNDAMILASKLIKLAMILDPESPQKSGVLVNFNPEGTPVATGRKITL